MPLTKTSSVPDFLPVLLDVSASRGSDVAREGGSASLSKRLSKIKSRHLSENEPHPPRPVLETRSADKRGRYQPNATSRDRSTHRSMETTFDPYSYMYGGPIVATVYQFADSRTGQGGRQTHRWHGEEGMEPRGRSAGVVVAPPSASKRIPPPGVSRQTPQPSASSRHLRYRRRPADTPAASPTHPLSDPWVTAGAAEATSLSEEGVSAKQPGLQDTPRVEPQVLMTDLETGSGAGEETLIPGTLRQPVLTEEALSGLGHALINKEKRIYEWLADCEVKTQTSTLPSHLPDISYTCRLMAT